MPTYNFKNNETNEEFQEFFTSFSDCERYLIKNPHITKLLTTAKFISGRTTEGGRLPGGFKDRLKEMKKKHPKAKGVDHLI